MNNETKKLKQKLQAALNDAEFAPALDIHKNSTQGKAVKREADKFLSILQKHIGEEQVIVDILRDLKVQAKKGQFTYWQVVNEVMKTAAGI